ncbi:MAG: pyridoxamine 5'-phosphate oxidase [Acidobacteria bacterium]|nr:pyridoxamine 5'-phosphate oxidase [Acidobacteriota bacterium]MCA1607950.1 pyridoxamine 5'-phosphate oxidase [Acidobacteriota bacterium]
MNAVDLSSLRKDYSLKTLSKSSVSPDPFQQFSIWFDEARTAKLIEPNAMTLSTVDAHCRPSSRVVLLKRFDNSGFTFYTNYESKKGRELAANPHCSLHFFWSALERQAIILGEATKTTRDESEAYFNSRPLASRLGAWVSRQSSAIESREILDAEFEKLKVEFDGKTIPLPPFWGGFRVVPNRFEFWQGRANRLHDRICYEPANEEWKLFRLSP